jgi:PTS system nitrogen regulatory IIA component
MELGKLLRPEAVKVLTAAASKKRLIHDLADLFNAAYQLPTETVLGALMERETLGPTGVGHGVALPHARLKDTESVIGAFIVLEKPVDFEAVDRQPVDIAFGLLAPENAGVEHLKALALVSRTLRDQSICGKLRRNPDSQTLHTILCESQSVQAA